MARSLLQGDEVALRNSDSVTAPPQSPSNSTSRVAYVVTGHDAVMLEQPLAGRRYWPERELTRISV